MRAPQRGFTLVELLIALAVMGLLAVLSWRALDGMTRAQTLTRTHTDEVLTLQAGLAQWNADLDAMVVPRELPGGIDWDGRALRIARSSGDGDDTGPRIVAWTRGTGAGTPWLRWQSPVLHSRAALLEAWQRAALWAQNPGSDEQRNQVAIVPLSDWRIFYYRGGAWTNPLSSGDTQAGSTQQPPPDGVRLVLDLTPGGALAGLITRDWVRPTMGGGK